VKLGETYEAAMVLSSLSDGEGNLVLRENGNIIAQTQVKYKAGKNRFTVPLTLRSARLRRRCSSARCCSEPDCPGLGTSIVAVYSCSRPIATSGHGEAGLPALYFTCV